MNNKRGFTLVELLVVVLIIGVLSAIALPQYTRTVERSRSSEARLTLKAMADAANRFYMNSNNSYSPGGTNMTTADLDIDPPLNPGATAASPWIGSVGNVTGSNANRLFFYSIPTVTATSATMRAQRNLATVNNGYTINYVVTAGRLSQINCTDGGGANPVANCGSLGLRNPINY